MKNSPLRNLVLSGCALCFAACLSAALPGCSLLAPTFIRPTVSVLGIELRGGNLLQQNFAVKLSVQNPNERALPVRGLHVVVRVGGDEIASGDSDRAFVVPPLGETAFDMTVKANLAIALLKLADKMDQHADLIEYQVTGTASIDLPFLRDLPFTQSGTFSLKGVGITN